MKLAQLNYNFRHYVNISPTKSFYYNNRKQQTDLKEKQPSKSQKTNTISKTTANQIVEVRNHDVSKNGGICGAKHFGCYKKSQEKATWTRMTTENSTVKSCLHLCQTKHDDIITTTAYAGVKLGGYCLCNNDVKSIIHLENSGNCNQNCSDASANETTCRGTESVELYQVIQTCEAAEDEVKLRKYNFGCFQPPLTDDKSFVHYNKILSAVSCFNLCEEKGHLLALVGSVAPLCRCGRLTRQFNLENKLGENCTESDHVTVFRTRVEDDRCSKMSFINNSTKKVTLVSAPSSGNTWLRYLIEKSTGYFTGSVYNDKDLFNKGYLGEIGESGLLKKDHMLLGWRKHSNNSDAFLFLIRDPYDAFVGSFNLKSSGGHIGTAGIQRFRTKFKLEYTKSTIAYISNELVTAGKPVYIVYYEDLKKVIYILT